MKSKLLFTFLLAVINSVIANAQIQPKVNLVKPDTLFEKLNLNLCDFGNTDDFASLDEKKLNYFIKDSTQPYESQMRIFKPDALFKYTMPVHIPKTDEKLYLEILEPEVRSRNQQS